MTTLTFPDEATENTEPTDQWRLARVELVNWGTLRGFVAIDVARRGHLFTGASGSGKSSLLDAIATVVTPDKWLRLNAAAQDGNSRLSDRSLMSYVRGAWTKEAHDSADRATTTYLRPRATWSGILLRYENPASEPVTLARVFHAPGTRIEPAALKDARLFIRDDVDLMALKPHVEAGIDARRMAKAFPEALITTGGRHGRFHDRIVRQFGFRSDATLHLLHKTQSAKNLGTLDALFRGFMLDSPGTFARADNAVEQFVELDRAHAHVVDLRRQADALRGIDAAITAYDSATAEVTRAVGLLDAVEPHTSTLKLRLAREALGPARAALARVDASRGDAKRERDLAAGALASAEARVREEGGTRVEVLQTRLDAAIHHERAVERQRALLESDLAQIGAPVPQDATQFAELISVAASEAENDIPAVAHEVRDAASEARRALARVDDQLAALREHRSNIDPRLLGARRYLAHTLGVPESSLPFVAELLSVAPEHAAWRGAIERALTPLSTTMLVGDERLAEVRRAVNTRHLGVRLVIEAVPPFVEEPRRPREPRSLAHRVVVADTAFRTFVLRRIVTDFDHACVDHPDDLDGVKLGVTIVGLLKRSSRRYEKDDRSAVDDPARWVLGGDTEARLDALLAQRRDATEAMKVATAADVRADAEREAALARRDIFRRVSGHAWEHIDVAGAAAVATARRAELDALTAASSSLSAAQQARDREAARLETATVEFERLLRAEGSARDALERLEKQLIDLERSSPPPVGEQPARLLDERFRAARRSLTLDTIDEVARAVQTALAGEKDAATRRESDAATSFAGRAAQFQAKWAAASAELTTEIGDRYGYRELLEGILARGLPEKESEFRRLLRERTRDVVAHLLADLRDAPGLVRERTLPVNASLGRSPFDGIDRFLEIDVRTSRTPEVEEFLTDLRRVVEGNWADESTTGAEERFAVLQRVIGRLGSKDRVDLDWRTRVLDTRLHVTFLAREKDATGRVVRVYDSAEGLSGGQRQKLVIFCLAAALRYQLTDDESDVPRFGSIILDEAFDKADSRYTRNAMDVFRAFGFHMILATPQKLLQTLEPYVGAITSVSNPERNSSRLANVVFNETPSDARPSDDESDRR